MDNNATSEVRYLDGSWLLDGSVMLNSEVPKVVVPEEVNASDFARMSGCTKPNVTQWINEGKLTEGHSWRKDGVNTMIHVERAKIELLTKFNPRQVKNKKLFAFLGIDENPNPVDSKNDDDIDEMPIHLVRNESEREQLRILQIERHALEGLYWKKEDVEKNMEAAALTLKTIFEGLAARSIAEIRNAPTDREAENILRGHIEKALEQVEPTLIRDLSRA